MSAPSADGHRTPTGGDPGLGDLLGRLTDQFSTLVRQEVELAKTEAKQEARVAAKAGALLGAAGVLGFLALLLLTFAIAWGLAALVPTGVAFLITAVLVGAVAAVLGLRGRDRVQDVEITLPETTQSIQDDVRMTKEQTR